MLKILGVGLSRTGTRSLAEALRILGYNTLHWAPERLRDTVDGNTAKPEVRKYDDVDAVVDIPAAYFWRELDREYPGLKFILTVRERDSWLESVAKHYARIGPVDPNLQAMVYGSTKVIPWLYWRHYVTHTGTLMKTFGPDRLLVMDILQDPSWQRLCWFLNKPIPDVPFPHKTDAL